MNATLNLTPEPATGSVLLDIDRGQETVLRVLRTDANGTAEVRGSAGQFPSVPVPGSAARVILSDYEAAAGDLAYAVELAGGEVLRASTRLQLESPWLTVPLMPQHSEAIEAVMAYSAGRASQGAVHVVLGREDPLPKLGRLSRRAGSLVIAADFLADALRIERVFDWAQVVMLRGLVPGMDMYLVPESVSHAPAGQGWEVTVSYVQVARPAGAQSGALGWTYAALTRAQPSYAALPGAYASYDELRANRARGAV